MKLLTMTVALALVAPILAVPASAQTNSTAVAKPKSPNTIMPNSSAISIIRSGSQPARPAPADYFSGVARVGPALETNAPSQLGGAFVTFDAGARTNWHTHPLGQTLIVTTGVGRVQSWNGPLQEMRVGDVVQIPPGVKHWHGAAPDASMTHVALAESQNGKSVDWLEPVGDAQYGAPLAGQSAATAASTPNAQPSRAQQLMGDIAPKMAQLTDEVLYGDIWERPQLSKRDRSLATVSALVALNRPGQLRSHLAIARENGVTEEELIETITHLAFYAGWPNAVTAVGIAREVFEPQKPQGEGAAPSTK